MTPYGRFTQVMVNALANSRTFQRFAIRTNSMFSDMAKKANEHQGVVSERGSAFWAAFREEVGFKLRRVQCWNEACVNWTHTARSICDQLPTCVQEK